jgi:dTMP kinase
MRFQKRFVAARSLLDSKDFRKLCVSQIFGGLGEWIATLALIALVWDRTHSALASGLVLAFRILPAAVIGSFLGALVDRLDRRRVLVACTAGRACVYGALPLVGGIAPVLGLAFIAEIGSIAYIAARDATLPRMVPTESLPAANAISMGSAYGMMPIGSGLFAIMAWLESKSGVPAVSSALGLSSALLFAATLLIGRVQCAAGASPRMEREPKDGERFAGLKALRELFRADPILRRVMLGGTVAACGGGAILTLGLAYVRGTLGAGQGAYSGLLTAFAAGAAIGVAAVSRGRKHMPKLFHLGIGTMGAILIGMALVPSKAMGYAMGFVFGGAFVATFLGGVTIMQERIHDSIRGRAFAMAHSGLRVGAVGMGVLAAWLAKVIGTQPGFLSMDGTQVVLGIAGCALFGVAVLLTRPIRVAIATPAPSGVEALPRS